MKNLIIILLSSLYILVGCEKTTTMECDKPLKLYDELINRENISTEEKQQLIELRDKLKSKIKNATTEHFAIVACGEAYDDIEKFKK